MDQQLDQIHKKIAKRAEDISMTVGIISTVVSVGASYLEPSGLSAFAVFLGISDPPLIVAIAPIIANIATATALVSGTCFLYSKWKG